MKRIILFLFLLSACAQSDAPPRGAVEAEFAVTMIEGDFDPDRGMQLSMLLYILIDEERYVFQSSKKTKVAGEKPNAPPAYWGGRKVLVKGKIKGDEYYATYVHWLPVEGDGETPTLTIGIPVDE